LHLKSVEIQGFKTFAKKTEMLFEPGITAIVGPNGSGKSNLVDAIRWVLGERSARELRGAKMEEVIYSGGDRRQASGVAEVRLVVDNSDGRLPLPYSEIEVVRRGFKSGESEYRLNGARCRLRDIEELLPQLEPRAEELATTLLQPVPPNVVADCSTDPATHHGLSKSLLMRMPG